MQYVDNADKWMRVGSHVAVSQLQGAASVTATVKLKMEHYSYPLLIEFQFAVVIH